MNDVGVSFELDTGSFISTICTSELSKLGKQLVRPTMLKARSYGQNSIKFLGEVDLSVKFNNKCVVHTFYIVDINHVNLLGRDLCSKLNICVSLNSVSLNTNNVLNKFSSYLKT